MDEQVDKVDRNVFEKAVTDTADALLKKWGIDGRLPGEETVSTPVGEITRLYSSRTYFFKTVPHDWNTIVIGNGNHGDPFRATEIVQNVVGFCATEDFLNKVQGSIGTLKRIHRALRNNVYKKEESYLNGVPCVTILYTDKATYHFMKDNDGSVVLTGVFSSDGKRLTPCATEEVWKSARESLDKMEFITE